MGADNSKARKFWEFHHDGQAVSVALWHTWQGEHKGYWCGYVGFTDPDRLLPDDTYFHWGPTMGSMNTSMIPEIGISVVVEGFDTLHACDVNIGPDGEPGHSLATRDPTESIVWTKEKVFEKLRDVIDEVLGKENN